MKVNKLKEFGSNAYLHGHNRKGKTTPEYRAYYHAKDRCNRKTDKGYEYYGGRGIEFKFDSFEEFIEDIGLRPSPMHSLDRRDNDGHYEIGNVRWATKDEQMANQRRSLKAYTLRRIIQLHGIGYTYKEISTLLKIPWPTAASVMYRERHKNDKQ